MSVTDPLGATDSPAAARRRLRFALRNARDEKGKTQAEVAAGLEWSVSKINRIENGEVTISPTDLRALMELLGVTEPATVELLTGYARAARRRGWWDGPEVRPHLTQAMRQLIQYEAEATAIRCFQPTLIPGALQTAEYARAVLDFWSELSEETRATRQVIRAERGRRLFDRPDRPLYLVLLDASVVQRQVGGPEVMAEQLRSVLAMIRAGTITVRLVPMIHGAMIGQAGNFTVIDLPEDENAVVYREMLIDDDHVRDDAETVERYRRVFEQMWDVALDPDESATVIDGNAATMSPSILRPRPGS
ncbi:MAG TPA: helix-turn-helix transcriptional regulator [Micromonosporaceae bacterium]|jgi:transcriptional regulator with XRE-family HTH domain